MMSAMARPASLPRNQAAMVAVARSISQGTISGLPENRITITGLPSASTASASSRWRPGSPRSSGSRLPRS